MANYRTRATVDSDGVLRLPNVPFAAGDVVDVIVRLTTDDYASATDPETAAYRALIRETALDIMHASNLSEFGDEAKRLIPPVSRELDSEDEEMLFELALRVNMEELYADYLNHAAETARGRSPTNNPAIQAVHDLINTQSLTHSEDIIDAMIDAMYASLKKTGPEECVRYTDGFLHGFIIGSSILDENKYNYWSAMQAPYDTKR